MIADLASYILRKNIDRAAKVIKSSYRLFPNEVFDKLNDDNFRLVLMSSFHKKDQVLGRELFEAADSISREYLFSNFEYILRIGEEGTPRWNAKFYAEHIDSFVAKVFICGPPQAITEIRSTLSKLGIPDSKLWCL